MCSVLGLFSTLWYLIDSFTSLRIAASCILTLIRKLISHRKRHKVYLFKVTFFVNVALELLQRMLEFNPDKRISIIESLTHRYFTTRQHPLKSSLTKSITRESSIKKSSASRSRSKTPKKGHHQSLLHSQPLNKINL